VSEAADREAERRHEIRQALPPRLVAMIQRLYYHDIPEAGAIGAAHFHLVDMVEQGLIEKDGKLTPHGYETLQTLALVAGAFGY